MRDEISLTTVEEKCDGACCVRRITLTSKVQVHVCFMHPSLFVLYPHAFHTLKTHVKSIFISTPQVILYEVVHIDYLWNHKLI